MHENDRNEHWIVQMNLVVWITSAWQLYSKAKIQNYAKFRLNWFWLNTIHFKRIFITRVNIWKIHWSIVTVRILNNRIRIFIAPDKIFEISNKHVIKTLSAKLHIFGKKYRIWRTGINWFWRLLKSWFRQRLGDEKFWISFFLLEIIESRSQIKGWNMDFFQRGMPTQNLIPLNELLLEA